MGMDRTNAEPVTRSQKRLAPKLSILTLLLFSAAGIALIIFQDRDPLEVVIGEADNLFQIVIGIVVGLLIALGAWWIIKLRAMTPIRVRYSSIIGPVMARRSDRIMVSICAGFAEELFFRGAIQHWLGIIAPAIIFVAIHGYLDPRDWRISLYGTYMTLGMIAIGWAAAEFGLIGPMLAHTMIDIVLLEKLHAEWMKRSGKINPANTYADRYYPR